MAPGNVQFEKRARLACDNCRRKKTRCPGEMPGCSSCARLGRVCTYSTTRQEARIKVANQERSLPRETRFDSVTSDRTQTVESIHGDTRFNMIDTDSGHSLLDQQDTSLSPSSMHSMSVSTLNTAFQIYFDRHHRQPIWLFDFEKGGDYSNVADEVAFAVLALSMNSGSTKSAYEKQLGNARKLVMLQVANGSVRLGTIEALCLISLSCFLGGELHLGRFHLSLGLQLCQAAYMDMSSSYDTDIKVNDRKKHAFWSLQILEFYHGQSHCTSDLLDYFAQGSDDSECSRSTSSVKVPPSIPEEDNLPGDSTDCGIWSILLQLACVWSQARTFMSACVADKVQEPWRADSSYSQILAELLVVESRTPMRHRWQNVKFQDQSQSAIQLNSHYLKPWLATQIIYRMIYTLMNHPFLYMAAAQRNKKLAVLNTFWTRSSQLALIHATWIVRLVNLALDRQILLSDAIFAQAVAIAATVHLYYLSASNPRLKKQSVVDLTKCKGFVERFSSYSPLCAAMDKSLEKLLHAALGTSWTSFEYNPPTQIPLRTRLMWDVLELACSNDAVTSPKAGNGLLHWSLAPIIPPRDRNHDEIIFEVGCAISDDTNDVDSPDGGQSAPVRVSMTPSNTIGSAQSGSDVVAANGVQTFPNNPQAANTSNASLPWNHFDGPSHIGIDNFDLQAAALGDIDNAFWWDFGNVL